MNFFSTNGQSALADFKQAAIKGLAPDKGLYYPEQLPVFEDNFIEQLKQLSKAEIAYKVIQPYVGSSIPAADLQRICAETVDFEFPLVQVTNDIYSLELFHGPTLAFKDVGARFMSRCLGYFSKGSGKQVTVLVATSGDTGSAVANGFLGVEGVRVVILYPSGKVSPIQEKQLTTLGQNITALEVAGTFDDCQQMVKQAFADEELNSRLFLTSANSINIARWLPQQFYYLYALQQWPHKQPPVISVPSGNFGNICAGLLAHLSGMPALHFVAACNANNVFTRYLESGEYNEWPAVPTLSNAMDVGAPSNYVRLQQMFGHSLPAIRKTVSSYTVTDEETNHTIAAVYNQHHYLCDPHGAVAFAALQRYLAANPGAKGIFLETAHPCKFIDVVQKAANTTVLLPASVQGLLQAQKQSVPMAANFNGLKQFLSGLA